MSNEIEVVITSKDKTNFETPAKKAKSYGDALGGVGDKADASEQRILGARDAIDGAAAVMAGPGEQGISAYLQGWADLASGIVNFVIPSLASLSKAAIKSAATHVANVARMIAAWVMMSIQAMASAARIALAWLIAMGPIALVVIAIAAVIAIIILLVKNWDKVKAKTIEVAKAIGNWIANAVRAVVNHFVGMLRFILGVPGTIARYLGNMFSSMVSAFGKAWTALSGAWGRFWGWVSGWKKALNFSGMFDGIKNAFKSSINWLIGKWNNLSFSMPSVDTKIPGVGTIGGWSIGTPNIPYLAKGGRITKSGLAVVGEEGAEVVSLPAGATVHPNGSSSSEGALRAMAWELLLELLQKMVNENNRGITRLVTAGSRGF